MRKGLLALTLAVIGIFALGVTGYGVARANGLSLREVISGDPHPAFDRVQGAPMEHRRGNQDGPLSPYMETAIAEAFGLTLEDYQARRESGESLLDIASELGFTVEDFQLRIEEAHQKALENAVSDGVITQEQADALQGKPFRQPSGGPMGGFYGPHKHGGFEMGTAGVLEEVLGLTMEEFHSRLKNGETFESILESQGFTAETFAQAIADARIAAVQAALEAGEINQEQADMMIERIQQILENGFEGFGSPGFHGPGRGHGRHGFGPFGPQPLNPDDSPSDSEAAEF